MKCGSIVTASPLGSVMVSLKKNKEKKNTDFLKRRENAEEAANANQSSQENRCFMLEF